MSAAGRSTINALPQCTPACAVGHTCAAPRCRCLSKTAADPDHAEQVMSEVCLLGDLTPNATTHILLAEIRVRFEQLLGL